jgi:hypothetical protein
VVRRGEERRERSGEVVLYRFSRSFPSNAFFLWRFLQKDSKNNQSVGVEVQLVWKDVCCGIGGMYVMCVCVNVCAGCAGCAGCAVGSEACVCEVCEVSY